MDVDNVFLGAGGKNEKPHDHNRDWTAAAHHKSVEAAQRAIRELNAAARLAVFADLHDPGPADRDLYFYITPRDLLSEVQRKNLDIFFPGAAAEISGPLPFKNIVRESGPKYDKDWEAMSKTWVNRNTNDSVVAVTLEIAWNTTAAGQANYQRVGRELGLSIERYLSKLRSK